MNLTEALAQLDTFARPAQLTRRIADLESVFQGQMGRATANLVADQEIEPATLDAAIAIKRAAGQINVAIHALGILLALPHLLDPDEEIQYISLGAGNTGRPFDLETDRRVAEFKFINWRGGAEAIRQNSIFIDLLNLLQDKSGRRRFMYLLNREVPIRFLHGNRSISSILSKSSASAALFATLYGTRYSRVSEWYAAEVRGNIEIVDLESVMPGFASESLKELADNL